MKFEEKKTLFMVVNRSALVPRNQRKKLELNPSYSYRAMSLSLIFDFKGGCQCFQMHFRKKFHFSHRPNVQGVQRFVHWKFDKSSGIISSRIICNYFLRFSQLFQVLKMKIKCAQMDFNLAYCLQVSTLNQGVSRNEKVKSD